MDRVHLYGPMVSSTKENFFTIMSLAKEHIPGTMAGKAMPQYIDIRKQQHIHVSINLLHGFL
mgnify:CR=1 FL=1